MISLQIYSLALILIGSFILSKVNGQANYGEGLQQYYAPEEVIKPVRDENDDSSELSRYYRAEPGESVAQPSLQYPQQPLAGQTEGIQYFYQSPGFQQQQLQPQAYYQQQQLLPQVLYQQQQQAQPQIPNYPQQPQQGQQLRSLQEFADPRFQQDYKYRMIYTVQENPTPPPQPAPIQSPAGNLPQSPFQFQPPHVQGHQYAPQQVQNQLIRPVPQSQPIQLPQLGVSYSSAGAGVSKTSFSGNGISYSF